MVQFRISLGVKAAASQTSIGGVRNVFSRLHAALVVYFKEGFRWWVFTSNVARRWIICKAKPSHTGDQIILWLAIDRFMENSLRTQVSITTLGLRG